VTPFGHAWHDSIKPRIDLETLDLRNGRDDRIVTQIDNCHDWIHGVLNALISDGSD
jgi:hypothetical protein